MKIKRVLLHVAAIGFVINGSLALAQSASEKQVDDQADVWALVEQQWNAEEKGDNKWMDQLLVDDFSGWGKDSPAPRSKASTAMWDRFSDQHGEMLAHELYPLSIVVHGDVAIAHYLYTSATKEKRKDGKIETTNGRYTDILVRTADGWKFIAWAGGDD